MKTKKSLFAKILTVAMISAMLTGCGGTASDADTAAAGSSSTSAGSDGMVNINVARCTFNLGAPDSEQVKKVEDAINEYIKDKINVRISLTDIATAEYVNRVNLSLANNEINLLWTASWEPTIGTNDLVPSNAVYDITDLLPGTPLYDSMDAGQWEATKYNGRNYFIPVYKDNVEGFDIIVRKELVDRYGWDLSNIKSLEDIEPMLADCKAEGLKYPYFSLNTAMFYRWYIDSFDFFTADATANWVAVDRDTDTVVDVILTDEYKEFCTLMSKWADAGYISEDDVTKTTSDTVGQTQDWGFTWWTDIPVNDEADARYEQDVEVIPITERWAHSTSALGSCYCISAGSTPEQAQACIDFMGLLYTDNKLADLYTFGIEGEDFTYDEKGQIDQSSEKYNHSMWESASATIVTPLANEPADKASLYEGFNGSANVSGAAGFRFDKKPVEAQFSACQNVFEQYGFSLENGGFAVSDVESTIEAYQAALDEAGYQEVLAEFTSQYDKWKANK